MLIHRGEIARHLLALALAASLGATSARADSAPIEASMDAAKRTVRLEPIGATIKIPDDLAVYGFIARPDYLSISAQLPDLAGISVDIDFRAPTCREWFAASDASYQKKSRQPGMELFDDRWNLDWLAKGAFEYICLDRSSGGSAQMRAQFSYKEYPQVREPFCQFTANVADALLPGTNRAVAACLNSATAAVDTEAARPKSSINVDYVQPRQMYLTIATCDVEGRLCDHAAKYREIHQQCVDGNAGACSAMGMLGEIGDDFKSAATFYQRACELGASDDACQRAKKNAKRVK